MKTDFILAKGIVARLGVLRTAVVVAGVLLGLTWTSEAASKKGGGGGNTATKPIDVKIWLGDFHPVGLPNGMVADGDSYTSDPTLSASAVEPPYKHGEDHVGAQIGRDQDIVLHLNATQYKRPPIRHFLLSSGFPEFLPASEVCTPSGLIPTGDRPVLGTKVVPSGFLQIFGPDFDDTPPGVVRHVNARWVVGDDAGRTWTVFFGPRRLYYPNDSEGFIYAPCGSCMLVERLPNTLSGSSRWRFSTEGQEIKDSEGNVIDIQHLGYLYFYSSGPTSSLIFAGVVNLALSGAIESLTAEPVPSGEGYTVPDDPPGCPLP